MKNLEYEQSTSRQTISKQWKQKLNANAEGVIQIEENDGYERLGEDPVRFACNNHFGLQPRSTDTDPFKKRLSISELAVFNLRPTIDANVYFDLRNVGNHTLYNNQNKIIYFI